MSVYKNMAFGLIQAKTPKDEIERRVRKAAKILDIESYLDRTPRALSGGQRQRVAIGRAIVREPDVFLFDEPLSNLDAALRGQTRLEIARLHKRLKTTIVYVTHDQVEAMTLADKIVVLRDGLIEQYGAPISLYEKPANKFVAGFIGSPSMNFFEASKTKTGFSIGGKSMLSKFAKTVDAVDIGIRPEHLKQCTKQKAILSGEVDVMEHLGDHVLAHMVTKTKLDKGQATYSFMDENSALRNLETSQLTCLPKTVSALHFGAISLIPERCGTAYEKLMADNQDKVLSIDPNIRLGFIHDEKSHRVRINQMIAMADIIKVSDEDLDWIAHGKPKQDLLDEWLKGGASVVLLTKGAEGVTAYLQSGSISIPALNVEVVDTIGAGDTFNAGFLSGLRKSNLLTKNNLKGVTSAQIKPALELAAKVAAFTVSKIGANPPWANQL